jgi:anti-sigma regulatory factor (Ser/Thr protein kinase)
VGESLTIELRNSSDAIAPAAEEAEAWLEAFGPSPKTLYLVPLAIEEIVTNCIQYGYDDSDEHTILITLSVADRTLTMTVIDDGHAFDPLARATPDLSVGVEERQIGGLGIHLLRNLADEMTYERRDGVNRLTLTKQLF